MMSKKETLIETLHGSLTQLEGLTELISQEDIYDETGHVDTDFLIAILEWMTKAADLSVGVQKSMNKLLGVDDILKPDKKKADLGDSWNVEEILRHCTLEEGVMKLPNVQLNKKSYSEAKKWIEEAGGRWSGGKIQGFTFPFNPERVFSILNKGERCNLAQKFQFFETPPEVADWLVMIAGGIHKGDTVLEPSAGRGALIKAIHKSCPDIIVDCYEMMPENKEILTKLSGIRIIGDDFKLSGNMSKYSKIIANPPFSGNQDIEHVMLMYDRLEDGGTLASITSAHWVLGQEKKCQKFREWIDSVGGKKFEIQEGAFRESGTEIKTMAIVITKS